MNRWLALAFCCAVVLIACASVPHRLSGVTLAPDALAIANSVYVNAEIRNEETGLCLASEGYSWGWAADGKLWARVTRFALAGRQAARFDYADSMHLYWHGNICGDSLPSWHTHLRMSMEGPSMCDEQSLSVRPKVPFALIQYAPDKVLVYWIEPGKHYKLANDSTRYCAPRSR